MTSSLAAASASSHASRDIFPFSSQGITNSTRFQARSRSISGLRSVWPKLSDRPWTLRHRQVRGDRRLLNGWHFFRARAGISAVVEEKSGLVRLL